VDLVALENGDRPAVSIILPTYNRARFLPQAFEAIKSQQFQGWELIVVDDGSTDDTRKLVVALSRGWDQPVSYVYQENQGAYGARNTGLDLARGGYIAFYDSDDVWLPHHLHDSVAALEAHPEVDWAYGACRVEDASTGRTLIPNTLYFDDGRPRPALRLKTRSSGGFQAFDDPGTLKCLLAHGLFCGLQNSVIRRQVFHGRRFENRYRNEGEDVLFAIRAVAAGCRLGYFDNVHVVYCVHEQNSSAASKGMSLEKRVQVQQAILRGLEDTLAETPLPPTGKLTLRWGLGHVYFWHLGYSLLWAHGRRREAIDMFRISLRYYPFDIWKIKTMILCLAKSFVTGVIDRARKGRAGHSWLR
jgi:glycosyltransferase involved in cell wall biosynthesis